jgi:hypothetical protein
MVLGFGFLPGSSSEGVFSMPRERLSSARFVGFLAV